MPKKADKKYKYEHQRFPRRNGKNRAPSPKIHKWRNTFFLMRYAIAFSLVSRRFLRTHHSLAEVVTCGGVADLEQPRTSIAIIREGELLLAIDPPQRKKDCKSVTTDLKMQGRLTEMFATYALPSGFFDYARLRSKRKKKGVVFVLFGVAEFKE